MKYKNKDYKLCSKKDKSYIKKKDILREMVVKDTVLFYHIKILNITNKFISNINFVNFV
jgi:hypothetical protein